ncbi:MAG: phage tail sheath C-terminal domain-containing protein, partial [Verrucomicrobiota bacterium]
TNEAKLQITKGEADPLTVSEVDPASLKIQNVFQNDEFVDGATIVSAGSATEHFVLSQDGDGLALVEPQSSLAAVFADGTTADFSLAEIEVDYNALYNASVAALAAEKVTLPPSAAMAGIYAAVDRDRGVWKAPANVSVSSTIGLTDKITDQQQENLNVDPNHGKSINAIRAFGGRGIVVWGARTLDGNSNDWRYISVRRLFIMMEESIQKSISWAVFEPNVSATWLKVKASIESFMFGLWQQGALAGSTAAEAYFVSIGLGKTMTEDDVLNGRMIVQIGAAPSRPAEFIVLQFTQMVQQS